MTKKLRDYGKETFYAKWEYHIPLKEVAFLIDMPLSLLNRLYKFIYDPRYKKPDNFKLPAPRKVNSLMLFSEKQVETLKEFKKWLYETEDGQRVIANIQDADNVTKLAKRKRREIKQQIKQEKKAKMLEKEHLINRIERARANYTKALLGMVQSRRTYLKHVSEVKAFFTRNNVQRVNDGKRVLILTKVAQLSINEKKGMEILKQELSQEDFNKVVKQRDYIDEKELAHMAKDKKISTDKLLEFIKNKGYDYTFRIFSENAASTKIAFAKKYDDKRSPLTSVLPDLDEMEETENE